jgi:hypothetical protein
MPHFRHCFHIFFHADCHCHYFAITPSYARDDAEFTPALLMLPRR